MCPIIKVIMTPQTENMVSLAPSQQLSDAFYCSICFNSYNKPKILPSCGHCFCYSCIQAWYKCDGVLTGILKCPICRRGINLRRIKSKKSFFAFLPFCCISRKAPSTDQLSKYLDDCLTAKLAFKLQSLVRLTNHNNVEVQQLNAESINNIDDLKEVDFAIKTNALLQLLKMNFDSESFAKLSSVDTQNFKPAGDIQKFEPVIIIDNNHNNQLATGSPNQLTTLENKEGSCLSLATKIFRNSQPNNFLAQKEPSEAARLLASLRERLMCSMCKCVLDDPRMLPGCQHSFCLACLQIEYKQQQSASIKCAVCAKPCRLDKLIGGISNTGLKRRSKLAPPSVSHLASLLPFDYVLSVLLDNFRRHL